MPSLHQLSYPRRLIIGILAAVAILLLSLASRAQTVVVKLPVGDIDTLCCSPSAIKFLTDSIGTKIIGFDGRGDWWCFNDVEFPGVPDSFKAERAHYAFTSNLELYIGGPTAGFQNSIPISYPFAFNELTASVWDFRTYSFPFPEELKGMAADLGFPGRHTLYMLVNGCGSHGEGCGNWRSFELVFNNPTVAAKIPAPSSPATRSPRQPSRIVNFAASQSLPRYGQALFTICGRKIGAEEASDMTRRAFGIAIISANAAR